VNCPKISTKSDDRATPIKDLMPTQRFLQPSAMPSKSPLKTHKPVWRVVLGRPAWSKHTYERPDGDPLKLLGSVSKGLQVGALALTADGAYVQVVGDHLTPLKSREIEKAVANAPKESSPDYSNATVPWQTGRRDSPAPVVIVKKRRVAVLP
jgi:hypothetical protein